MTVLAGLDGGDAGDFPEVDGVLLLLRVAPGLPTEAVPLHPSGGALLPPPKISHYRPYAAVFGGFNCSK